MYWLQFIRHEFIWLRMKLTFTCFSLWTNYYFVIESLHEGVNGKLFDKIFIVNVFMHLLATWKFWPWIVDRQLLWRLVNWATVYARVCLVGRGVCGWPKWEIKPRGGGGGGGESEDTMANVFLKKVFIQILENYH